MKKKIMFIMAFSSCLLISHKIHAVASDALIRKTQLNVKIDKPTQDRINAVSALGSGKTTSEKATLYDNMDALRQSIDAEATNAKAAALGVLNLVLPETALTTPSARIPGKKADITSTVEALLNDLQSNLYVFPEDEDEDEDVKIGLLKLVQSMKEYYFGTTSDPFEKCVARVKNAFGTQDLQTSMKDISSKIDGQFMSLYEYYPSDIFYYFREMISEDSKNTNIQKALNHLAKALTGKDSFTAAGTTLDQLSTSISSKAAPCGEQKSTNKNDVALPTGSAAQLIVSNLNNEKSIDQWLANFLTALTPPPGQVNVIIGKKSETNVRPYPNLASIMQDAYSISLI